MLTMWPQPKKNGSEFFCKQEMEDFQLTDCGFFALQMSYHDTKTTEMEHSLSTVSSKMDQKFRTTQNFIGQLQL